MTLETTWQWPIPVDEYDVTSPLTTAEHQALDELLQLRSQPQRVFGYADNARAQLPRLIEPIYDGLCYGGFPAVSHGPVMYLFLKHTAESGAAYGQLSEADWLQIITTANTDALPAATRRRSQHAFLVTLYLLKCFRNVHQLKHRMPGKIAERVFGAERFNHAFEVNVKAMADLGYNTSHNRDNVRTALADILLVNQSPLLTDLDRETLHMVRRTTSKPSESRFILRIAYGLFGLGILTAPLSHHPEIEEPVEITDEWAGWCHRWEATSTLAQSSRQGIRNKLLQVGVWLRRTHPQITSPAQWNRQTCLAFVTAVCALHRGEWSTQPTQPKSSQPLMASTKRKRIDAVRTFFQDLQAWDWIPRRFNPDISLTAPAYLHAQIGPNPRIIEEDIWARLLQAGLDLTEADIQPDAASNASGPHYPFQLVQAVALIWVFGGLRVDEIRRLRVGCIQWDRLDIDASQPQPTVPIRVPANKTSGSFVKPISRFAAEAIREWEHVRPDAPALPDRKTGEMVPFLFMYRGRRIGHNYLNKHLIPLLCAKAGVPLTDAKGKITSHRARSTISNYLVTGEHAMTLLELKTWLGHSAITSTLHYVKPTLTRVAKVYAATDYFERNLRLVDVLVDQDAIRNGAVENWLHYDLGHGYCNNDFFVKCAHRLACARCSFYLPKDSSQAQMLEAQTNLRRMMQEIELTDEEVSAIEGDIAALDALLEQLARTGTPDQTQQETPS